jgi:uncharacterized protein (DUF433 family)
MWAKTTLYVLNKKVIFDTPEAGNREEMLTGQAVLQIPLKVASCNMEEANRAWRKRGEDTVGKVEQHKNIAHNQAVVAGTRIPVRSIKAFADAGYTVEQIKREYPTLTEEDIRAALKHAAAA